MSWIVVAYVVAGVIAAPVYGLLGDVVGLKRMLFVTLAVSMAGSLLCIIFTSMLMIVAAALLTRRLITATGRTTILSRCRLPITAAPPLSPRSRKPASEADLNRVALIPNLGVCDGSDLLRLRFFHRLRLDRRQQPRREMPGHALGDEDDAGAVIGARPVR
ncbi:MAG: MFS transporter [Acetobacteraceae bacterium]|nr:MFS transporter [Acetobacteraceae bacterium]